MNTFIAAAMHNIQKDKTLSPDLLANYRDSYLTGLLPFDYRNSTRSYIQLDDSSAIYSYDGLGVKEGSMSIVTGGTGAGKTTFLIQTMDKILKKFPKSSCLYFDPEGGADENKISTLARVPYLRGQIKVMSGGITNGVFFKMAQNHCDQKIQLIGNPEYMYDTGYVDVFGKPIKKLIPTIIILDSLPAMISEEVLDGKDLPTQTFAMKQAADNAKIFRIFNQRAVQANVIFFIVNWCEDKIDMNPFSPKKDILTTLTGKQIYIPGGNAVKYLSSNIIYLDHKKSIDGVKDAYHVTSRIVEFNLLKTRSNAPKSAVTMLFNTESVGYFDLFGTLLYHFIENGVAKKDGNSYKLPNYPYVKFSKDIHKFKEILKDDLGFRIALSKLAKEYYGSMTADSAKNGIMGDGDIDVMGKNILDRFNIEI